jgi:signal transduction histidine kinase
MPKPATPKALRKAATGQEYLAALCARQQAVLQRAGRSLHDQAGPLLSAAGIHLQLLAMDIPAARGRAQEIARILEQALDNVRTVSQELAASPVYRGGFQSALSRLAEETAESAPVEINVDYALSGPLPRETAIPLYEAASAAVKAAVRHGRATEIDISVRDKPALTLRIADNGHARGRGRALSVAGLLAREAGLRFAIAEGKSTIVSIRAYALRRSTGR